MCCMVVRTASFVHLKMFHTNLHPFAAYETNVCGHSICTICVTYICYLAFTYIKKIIRNIEVLLDDKTLGGVSCQLCCVLHNVFLTSFK